MDNKPINLYLRVSDYRTWLDCRRRFFLTNVYGVLSQENVGIRKPSTADIGTLVDHGLNALFQGEGRVPLVGAHNVPAGWIESEYADDWHNAIEMGDIMLDGFEEWWAEQPENQTLETKGIQVEVSHKFGPFVNALSPNQMIYVTLIGHIDYEAFDHKYNTLSVNDFKTVATLGQHLKQVDTQMNVYALLLSYARGVNVSIARHIQLRRVKRTARANPPFYGKRTLILNPKQLIRTEKLLNAALMDMINLRPWGEYATSREHQYYPSPNGECDWKCRVKGLCDMMDDGSDWESIAENGYGTTDNIPILSKPKFQLDVEEA